MIFHSYADESFGGDSKYLTIAGFLMTDAQFLSLNENWKEALGVLPYFHMCEGHHLKHPGVYQKLLSLLRRGVVSQGFAVAVEKTYYDERTREKHAGQTLKYWRGGAYTFAVQQYMERVGIWLDEHEIKNASVDYCFEAGYERCGEADDVLNMIASDNFYYPKKQRMRYRRHKFVDGKGDDGRVLQAGDILAWHFNKLHATGEASEDLNEIASQVDVHYEYFDPEHIDKACERNADVGIAYGRIRQARHKCPIRK